MNALERFREAWIRTAAVEKGYVNNPSDRGGATNHGITEAVARANGFKGDMKDLSKDFAESIAKRRYWDVLFLDDISALSPSIAFEVFDTGFLCGVGNAGRFLQQALNTFNRSNRQTPDYPELVVDGILGPATVHALSSYLNVRKSHGELVLLRALNAQQGAYLISIGKSREANEEFEFGWFLNRVVI
jgi:lysozyme family protein